MDIQQYINNVSSLFNSGNSTEHSYRGDLQQLLTSLLKDVAVTNEPKRIECGAPDYILTRKDIPIGYIEAKDVGVKLVDKAHKEQFDRYKAALNNLIITDYLEFHFYKNGVPVESVVIATIENGKIYAKPDSFDRFTALIENFASTITQTIKSPATLAQMMAAKAKLMANVIKSALDEDDKAQSTTDLQGQMAAFKSILIHDINNTSFADIYAQTIAYGLFAARYHDPTLTTFSRQEAATLIPQSNPFLRKLFQYIAGYELDNRLTWLVDELVLIFLATDVVSVMHNFGKSTRQHDPIIHFYETFLAEYDPKLRKSRGVWYTPEPVVSFIVRAVDDILKTHFRLPQGLADTSKTTIKVKTDKPDRRTASGYLEMEKELHRVQILDPATGTGTFLAQTIRHIYDCQFANMQGAWSGYVKEHLIPRLNGFELLMTSYAMAHLKLDMLLTETGYKPEGNAERLRVYLTNSLEEHHPDTGTLFASWLSTEANEANHIKRDAPVMVVMGNPPYSGHSSNKGEWIEKLIESYKKEPSGGKLQERNSKWLNDDYVKFIRYGQHFIDKNGEGVLAFITNHSYLDNPTFRGMRWALMQSFDDIYILDLHGNAKKKEIALDGSKDENVFDIQQGVSIALMVKTGKKAKGASANIWHGDIFGKREHKYNVLQRSNFSAINIKLEPSSPHYAWVQRDETELANYNAGFSVQSLFPVNSVGIVTSRDDLVIDSKKENLTKRMQQFFELSPNEVKQKLSIKENKNWTVAGAQQKTEFNAKHIQPIAYRPFDNRWVYYDAVMIERSRGEVMRQFIGVNNLGLAIKRQGKFDFSYIFLSPIIAEGCLFESAYANNTICPLYLYPDKTDILAATNRIPNLDMEIVELIASGLGLTFTPEKIDQANTFAPIDLLDYIYAILHSPAYRETYKVFLRIDFPRVPYPTDTKDFWRLVTLGGELRQLHLLEGFAINQLITSYPESGSNLVDQPHYDDGKVYINNTQYFEGISKLAWEFHIGGYQPAQKWLKDRKGCTLAFEDILHYQKIIKAMVDTDRLMRAIDKPQCN